MEFFIVTVFFMVGLVLGVYIMTQVHDKRESELMIELLELEDHVTKLRKYNRALLDKYKPKTIED